MTDVFAGTATDGSVTVTVTAESSFSFPFGGEWETDGCGYGDGSTGVTLAGSIASTALDGPTITYIGSTAAVLSGQTCGLVIGLSSDWVNFGTTTPSSITVQLTGGGTFTYTFEDADYFFNYTFFFPSPYTITYTWADGNSGNTFAGGVVSTVTFTWAGTPGISIAPTSVTLNYGATEGFTATTTSPSDAPVTWSCLYGTVDVAGFYTAPAQSGGQSSDTVTAALANEPDTTASAAVTLQPALILIPAGVRLPGAFPPTVFTKSATINPKVYMPVEDTTAVSQ